MSDQLKYFDGELARIDSFRMRLRKNMQLLLMFPMSSLSLLQPVVKNGLISHSQLIFSSEQPNLKTLSHMYRAAWRQGLKTTYYLRTLGASNIEKATVSLNQSKPLGDVASEPSAKKEFTEAEVKACSIEAMMNGEECEACQ